MHLSHQGIAELCQRLHSLMRVFVRIPSTLAESQGHYYLIQIRSLDRLSFWKEETTCFQMAVHVHPSRHHLYCAGKLRSSLALDRPLWDRV